MIKLTQTELSKLLSNKDLEPKEIAHQLHEHYWVIIKHLNEEQFGQNYKDTYPELAPTPPSAAAKEEPTADNTTSRFRPSR